MSSLQQAVEDAKEFLKQWGVHLTFNIKVIVGSPQVTVGGDKPESELDPEETEQ